MREKCWAISNQMLISACGSDSSTASTMLTQLAGLHVHRLTNGVKSAHGFADSLGRSSGRLERTCAGIASVVVVRYQVRELRAAEMGRYKCRTVIRQIKAQSLLPSGDLLPWRRRFVPLQFHWYSSVTKHSHHYSRRASTVCLEYRAANRVCTLYFMMQVLLYAVISTYLDA